MTIQDLVVKYQKERDFYLSSKYNEAQLRNDFLDPLFELLGWDIKNQNNKSTYEREVLVEETLKGNLNEFSKKPDYTFRLFAERKFFLEAKKPNVDIHQNDSSAKQLRRYGFTAKLKISVLSNFEYLIIYDTSIPVESKDDFRKAVIKKYHYTEFAEKLEELRKYIGRDSVYSGVFDQEWSHIEDKIKLHSVDNLFLGQINSWRILLGNEIYKVNLEITEYELNDIVQSYLNRIIFLRVCEDRNIEGYSTLLNYANNGDFNALIRKFEQADRLYNSGLFDQLLSNDIIRNISSAFWVIIKQLYYPESPYSFAVFSSDILGRIYEVFLSEKLIINNSEILLVRKPDNIDRDIVTTPFFIIEDILKNTIGVKCKNSTDEQILNMKFADISCGSGAFLLELFQVLNDIFIDYYIETKQYSKLIEINTNTYKLPFSIKRKILESCIYGFDKDYNAVEASKFGLLLKLLESENINSINEIHPILPDLSTNLHFGNSLLSSNNVQEIYRMEINPFDFTDLRFDIIVGNPPYMTPEDMNRVTPLELPLYKYIYESAYKQFDKYYLFLERGIELLKEDGILGYIVPSKFFKIGAGKKLRNLLVENKYLTSIVSFGANQIFNDKTTYTCLLFLNKAPQNSFKYAEVKDLNSWLLKKGRDKLFIEKSTSSLNEDEWILIPPSLTSVYDKILYKSQMLSELVGSENIFNGIQTSATNIYIHNLLREDDVYYYFNKENNIWKVEKELTRPYYKTTRQDKLYTYRPFQPNSFVIYPYKKNDDGIYLVGIEELQDSYPELFRYLSYYESELRRRDIKPIPVSDDEWYQYGRSHGIDKCEVDAKIVVGILSKGDSYAIDYSKTLLSSGGNAGYCIISKNEALLYSIYYLQAVLNSKYVEWFVTLYGTVFRGGYYSHGTYVLNKLPIRSIDFENQHEKDLHDIIAHIQEELIGIYNELDNNRTNRRLLISLERRFSEKKQELEAYLRQLYDLGNDDELIPLIKDLHGNN